MEFSYNALDELLNFQSFWIRATSIMCILTECFSSLSFNKA